MEIEPKTILNDELFLRQISKEVDFKEDNWKNAIRILKEYSKGKEKLLALASIQIGIPLRLIYIKNSDINIENAEHDEARVLINPIIIKEEGLTRFYEKCVSCLDYMGLVERPYKIELEYYDENLKYHKEVFNDFFATLLCHEIDHLNGILHIDKSLELYNMNYEDRKAFRETHKYEIIRKTGKFKLSTNKFVKLEDAIETNKLIK